MNTKSNAVRPGIPRDAGPEKNSQMSNATKIKKNRVAPLNFSQPPQVMPLGKPGTFVDEEHDSGAFYGAWPPASPNTLERGSRTTAETNLSESKMKEETGGAKKQGSPVSSQRRSRKMFHVEGENPYTVDAPAELGHGTQYAIDSLNEEVDEQMNGLDKKIAGMVNTDIHKSSVRNIKERHVARFHVENGVKKMKRSLNKLHITKGKDGTKFIRDSDESDSDADDKDALMTGMENMNAFNNQNGPRLVASVDPNVKKQLILALKMKRTYKSALQNLADKHRKLMGELDKLHLELAKAQEELVIANTQAAQNGIGGLGGFAVNLNGGSKRDEEDRARRERERKKLFATAGGGDATGLDEELGEHGQGVQAKRLCKRILSCLAKNLPLRKNVQKIEQRFGNSVASYFHFFQWIYLNTLMVCMIYIGVFSAHLYWRTEVCCVADDYIKTSTWFDSNITNPNDEDPTCKLPPCSSEAGHESYSCPDQLACRPRSYAGFIGWWEYVFVPNENSPSNRKLEGFLPEIFMFSSFTANEALPYTSMLLVSILIMTFATVYKWAAEDRKLKMIVAFEGQRASENKYAKLLLNCWDHHISTVRESTDHKLFIAESLRMLVQDAELAAESSSRTLKQKIVLYLKRALLIFVYFLLQLAGWTLIVLLIAGQIEFVNDLQAQIPRGLPIDVVPLTVTLLNVIMPKLIVILLKLEKYDDQGTVIKQTVFRTFLAKTFNILIQVMSYMLLADPFALSPVDTPQFLLPEAKSWIPTIATARFWLKKQFLIDKSRGNYDSQCRINQAGTNLWTFLITEWVIGVIFKFLFPAISIIIAKLKKKPFQRAEFNVSTKMIGLLYFMQICLVTMPFMPFVGSLFSLLLYINFKLDFILTNKFSKKPKKAWSAKDSGEFFLQFFLFSIGMWASINYLFLATNTQAKTCSSQFKFLPQSTELDGITRFTKMHTMTGECDVLWDDLGRTTTKKSFEDLVYDSYVELPKVISDDGSISASDADKFTASLETLAYSKHNIISENKLVKNGPAKGLTVSASSGYTSSWASKTDFDWNKIGVENCDISGDDCKTNTEHRAGSLRRTFKDWMDRVTGLEMELSTGKIIGSSDFTQAEIDLYLQNNATKYTLREITQTKDLLKSDDCTSSCYPIDSSESLDVPTSEFCARCGYVFAQKYRALRKSVLLNPSGEFFPLQPASIVAKDSPYNFSLQTAATKTYSNFGITNNERLIMCSCFKSCGPYVQSGNGFQPVRTFAQELPNFVTVLYGASVNGSLFAWTLVLALTVAWLFKKNSQVVSDDYAADQKFFFQDKISGLNKRNLALQKKYNRLRLALDS